MYRAPKLNLVKSLMVLDFTFSCDVLLLAKTLVFLC